MNVFPVFAKPEFNGKTVAVIGGGASGLGCAAVLAQKGFDVTIYEQGSVLGGQFALVPQARLPKEDYEADINWVMELGPVDHKIKTILNTKANIKELAGKFDYVADCRGSSNVVKPSFKNSEACLMPNDVLDRSRHEEAKKLIEGMRVAVLGGGATAVDCACESTRLGAKSVSILYRRGNKQMRITREEREQLLDCNVDVIPRVSPVGLELPEQGDDKYKITGIVLERMRPTSDSFERFEAIPESEFVMRDFDRIVCAFGFVPSRDENGEAGAECENVFKALPKGTVVQAVASGKECASAIIKKALCCEETVDYVWGFNPSPVSLETVFMNTCHAPNPFILAASPLTDGYTVSDEALKAGWGGVVVKTAFPHPEEMIKKGETPIHVPMDYMGYFGSETHGNCDNVSGHPLQLSADAVRRLKQKWGNTRIIAGSTGGPLGNEVCFSERPEMNGGKAGEPSKYFVDGCPCARCGWRRNAAMLEDAGADFVEFSLSCPQGGEGGEGSIAGQDPKTTRKIVEWVMSMERPEYKTNPSLRKPKIFKMTGAVTSIERIIKVIAEVLEKYGGVGGSTGFGGITLANSFPSASFGPWHKRGEVLNEQGLVEGRRFPYASVLGMSGHGVRPISTLSLASVQHLKVPTSGNGGVDGWRAAAEFLSLGVGTVQICALAEERGLRVINDLTEGLSSWMERAGFKSIEDLKGAAYPAIIDFMDITAEKRIPVTVNPASCIACHKCEDCPYGAIKLETASHTVKVDPIKCVGCSLCVARCPGACLGMRERVGDEKVEHGYW